MEYKTIEKNTNSDTDKEIIDQIKSLYYDAMKEISKLMFMYGVQYGIGLEKCLNDISIHFLKEKIEE